MPSHRSNCMNLTRLSAGLLAICIFLLAKPAHAQADAVLKQRVASELMRVTLSRLTADPLTADGLEGAVLLAREAVSLDPDSPELWRLALELAVLAEEHEFRQQALDKLLQLDKRDDVAALMRLSDVIERYQTADERIAAYDKLLSDENVEKIGAAIASRLALDAALLHRRQGDTERFVQRLTQSVQVDPSNRSAAAIAAGFFRMSVKDPFGEAELLTNLMLADPTDVITQIALGRLLLENGAYIGADRIYRLAGENYVSLGQMPTNQLLADLAIAQWANGKSDAAMETIRLRQVEMDNAVRTNARREDPDAASLELAKLKAPLDPMLASVVAVIRSNQSQEQGRQAAQLALNAYQEQIDAAKAATESPVDPTRIAAAYLEMAWVALWLQTSVERVPEYLAAASEIEPITDEAKKRFDGWMALRTGKREEAIEMLSPLAATDNLARFGLAVAMLEAGQHKDAARELLAVNRAQPGSLIGIWSGNRLAELLNRRMPLSSDAKKLEQLIASIHAAFFRYPTEPTLAVSLRVSPAQTTFAPYQPVIVNVEIANNSQLPLAIDRDGPIRSKVVLIPTMSAANVPGLGDLRPVVVNIAQRLRLLPGEKLVIPVNLRIYAIGDIINSLSVNGTILQVTALLNFSVVGEGSLRPGMLGSEVKMPLARLDGLRLETQWLEEMVEQLKSPRDAGVLDRMAQLSLWIGPRAAESMPPETRTLHENARRAFDDAFAGLDPLAQAWLLCVMPAGGTHAEGMLWVLSMARKSEDRLVKLTYLLFHTSGPGDPMLDAAKRGTDPVLRRIAEIVQLDLTRAVNQRQQ
jgi:tetratricopeptide (TPR) repeat protein